MRANETLHARIKAQILQKIIGGTWKPGYRLPVETDLARDHGVSRMTMNKVLTQLSSEGYLVRRKKSGTFVAQPRSQSAVLEITAIADEVAALGQSYRWELIEQNLRCLSGPERAGFGLPEDGAGPWLALRGLHFAADTPFCLETRVINPSTCPKAVDQDFGPEPPGSWLLRTVPWTSATHTVRAVGAGTDEAGFLVLRKNTPCLEILRETRTSDSWVTRVRLVYPGGVHQLFAQFGPQLTPAQASK
ncbi:MAG: GntR family transcriptional regulator [Rhodobacter sp.]|nr:GntR family transcriptional regulator [Rhodobacter sp.]